jgi:hypothetical protein
MVIKIIKNYKKYKIISQSLAELVLFGKNEIF